MSPGDLVRMHRGDLVAGVSVAMVLVPQSIAYATVAGMPPVHGLYAAAVAPVLAQLEDVPDERRGARFRCAVAFAYPIGAGGVAEHVVHGEMPGRIIRERRGIGGFGYDVVFVPDDQHGQLTSAEQPPEEKDAISHRGRAIRAIAPVVADVLAGL